MSSIKKCISRTSEGNSCRPHYYCQKNNNFIKLNFVLLLVLRIKRISRYYITKKDTKTKSPIEFKLKPKNDKSDKRKLLIQSVLSHLLDLVFDYADTEIISLDSNIVKKSGSNQIAFCNTEQKLDLTDEREIFISFIIDDLLRLVVQKGERNWLEDYCKWLFDNILQNITDVLPITSIWPDFSDNFINNNDIFSSSQININSVFENRYNFSSNFLKIRKKVTKKNKKQTTKIEEKEVASLDMKLHYSIIKTLPKMVNSSNFTCEFIPNHSIVVDIDDFHSCEEKTLQAEKLTKVSCMKYMFQKMVQTKFDQHFVSVKSQTNIKPTTRETGYGALRSWCQLLVESMLFVMPIKMVQQKSTELLLNTELNVGVLYFPNNSVSNILRFIETLLAECYFYQKAIKTCSCKFYDKKHNFLSIVLNILHILTKFLALTSYFQKTNILTFALLSKCTTIFLRCYSNILKFYDENEMTLTENFIEFEDLLKIQNNFFSLLLNINFPLNENFKKPNVFMVYKKLIQIKFHKFLKIHSFDSSMNCN